MMSDRIALNERRYGPVIAQIAGTEFNPAVNINFARIVDEEFLGGVMYSNYTGESIGIHVGALTPLWLNRDMLFISFDYPFNQLGVNRIFSQIAADNHHTLSFNAKLGFKPLARIEGVYRGPTACIVTCMERADCRFLNITPRTIDPTPRQLH